MLTEREYQLILDFDWTGMDVEDLIQKVKHMEPGARALFEINMTEKELMRQRIFIKMSKEDIEILKRKLYRNYYEETNTVVHDIFIAHAGDDHAIAIRLEHELKAIFGNNLKTFNSSNPSKIKGGIDWFHYITNEHKKAKLGLIMITRNSINNLWINFEAGGFFLRKESIAIPLFFDNNDLADLSFPLKGIQGKKLWQKEFRESLIAEISDQIGIKDYQYNDSRFVKNVVSLYSKGTNEIVNRDLIRIRNEAMATMRCSKPDFQFFERKINEINLIDNVDELDKLKTISEIGLEVTLNSFEGTNILLKQLSWYLPEVNMKHEIIEKVSELLWTWGMQAVEYQRTISAVKDVLDSIKTVHEIAIKYGLKHVADNCHEAIKSMTSQAKQDNLVEIDDFLMSVRL